MHIYYLCLCKQITIYFFRTQDLQSLLWLYLRYCSTYSKRKIRKERQTTEIQDADVILTGCAARQNVYFLQFWSHCGSSFNASQTALLSAGLQKYQR